jgi:hypothetical protein
VIDSDASTLKGMRLTIDYGVGNRLVRVEKGALLQGDRGAFLGAVAGEVGRVHVDVAALGIDRALEGSGELWWAGPR